MAADKFRIIYHPAPGPGKDGEIIAPEPVILGSKLEPAMRWIEQRLGVTRSNQIIWSKDLLPIKEK